MMLTFGDIDVIQSACKNSKLKDPLVAYADQKRNADQRGVEFKMTFSEWWEFWKDAYPKRGNKPGQYCMARRSDDGAYEAGNVYLATWEQNRRDFLENPVRRQVVKITRAGNKMAELRGLIAEVESIHGPRLPFELMMARRVGML